MEAETCAMLPGSVAITIEDYFYCLVNGANNSSKVLIDELMSSYFKALSSLEISCLSTKYLNTSRCTTLQLAMAGGFVKTAEVLINKRIDINVGRYDSLGTYKLPLSEAISGGFHHLVPLFVSNESKIETFCISKEETPFCSAIKMGLLDVAEELLNLGADINCQDHHLRASLLHYSAAHNKVNETEWLLDHGIKYSSNCVGQTPLHFACDNDSAEVAGFLVSKGFHLTCKDIAGYSPLSYACFKRHKKIHHTILNHFYQSDSSFKDDLLKLFMQIREDNLKFFLLGIHVKAASKDNFLEEGLHSAIGSGCCKVAEYLLLCGARLKDVNTIPVSQNIPLGVAISSTNPLQIDRVRRWTAITIRPKSEHTQKCFEWVILRSRVPMSLMDLSRIVIFKKLISTCTFYTYWEAINMLPLTSPLKKFINFSDAKQD